MLQLAKILKSNGVDGGLLIALRDIALEEINPQEPVFINFDGLPVPFFILDSQPKGSSKAVVHLNDITTLEDAEEVVGREMWLEGEWEEDDNEDFVGWTVLDKGREIGTVTGIEPIPGNLCLYIGETLIPLHEDFILEADPERQILDLDLPAGLL